jgi:DNA-binding response OmpR family regulator
MRVLLIEDNARLARFLGAGLRTSGFTVDIVGTAGDAEAGIRAVDYDAVVLDLGLPDYDGLVLLDALRSSGNSVPVLALTARDQIDDRVKGLNAGADDYMLKPFALEELVARLRALLRRPSEALSNCIRLGNTTFNLATREVSIDGAFVAISRRELDVFELLVRRAGRVVTKRSLDEKIYGFDDDVSSNPLEVTISRLRRDLRQLGASVTIRTFRGVGYLLRASD